ncbi:putative lipid II flippase FtsW [Hazenella coriacea]|uniref:Probable peptidoglycan glycosyltransferase FtsW n=1 Tax=Hazenella coriacea TaxID=1179467 RepID=A0A4R3L6M6_9BACL|nr:putative lipid II flippase FtsW [Hazenella coriacea]TCS94728.1 cell division protein FtsW [Hazenella coriacea]
MSKKQRKPDFWLILITFLLFGFGLVMVFSTSYYKGLTEYQDSYYFFKKQLSFGVIGLILFFIVSNIPYSFYRKHVGLITLFCLLSLVIVLIPGLGESRNGATRWLDLGFFSFQPSEYVKVGLVIYTASIMVKKQEVIDQFRRSVIPPLIVIGLFSLLLVSQPHFSAIVIIFGTCLTMIYCSGVRIKPLITLLLVTIPILVAVMLLADYRLDRVFTLLDPLSDPKGRGYQISNSLMAIGPGGLTGAGLGNSIQKMDYLPEAHTDFIFSIIAEEMGFIGSALLICLYILFVFRGVIISLQAPDQFGTLLGIGIVTLISLEALFNLGVVTAIVPVTGVPLPLISYGGTALMIKLFSLGVLLNISRSRVKKGAATAKNVSATPL